MKLLKILLFCISTMAIGTSDAAAAFEGAGGNYGGLAQTADQDPLSAALVNVDLLQTGRFTGSIVFQGRKYPLQGRFDAETANFEKSFPVPDGSGSTLVIRAQLEAADRTITGMLQQQSGDNPLLTAPFALSGALPDPVLGAAVAGSKRTAFIDPPNVRENGTAAAIEGAPAAQEIPGDGFFVITVGRSKSRAARFVGQLNDAEKFSGGSPLRGVNYTIFSLLYKRKVGQETTHGGQLIGNASVKDRPPVDIETRLNWGKRKEADPGYYREGISEPLFVNQAQLYPRTASGALVPIGVNPRQRENATLRIKRGNLANEMDARLTITAGGVKVEKTVGAPEGSGRNPYQIKVRINAQQGTYSGSFVHPDSGVLTKFAGAFQAAIGSGGQFPGEGRGSFKGSVNAANPAEEDELPESGSVRITVNAER